MPPERAQPFIKWAGGKRRLLPEIERHVPARFGAYYEPFVGGGALFWHLQAAGRLRQVVLGDANQRLICAYIAVRDNIDELVARLWYHQGAHSADWYKQVAQSLDDTYVVYTGARLIYLLRTSFNGLYRVNRQNGFNAPMGRERFSVGEANLRACSAALQGVVLAHQDYAETVRSARAGDFVYFDSPYVPTSETRSFVGYTPQGFHERDHVQLRNVALRLKARGVHVLLSNSAAPLVRDLYGPYFALHQIQAARSINARGSGRRAVPELLIT